MAYGDGGVGENGLGRISIAEIGMVNHVVRRVEEFGIGGDQRAFFGPDMYAGEVKSSMERPALIAFNAYHDAASEDPSYERHEGTGRFARGLNLAIVNERQNGLDAGSDIDRAHAILKSVALVEAMEYPAFFEPSSPMVGNLFGSLGIELDRVKGEDAHCLAVGMGDLVKDVELAASVNLGLAREEGFSSTPLARHLGDVARDLPEMGSHSPTMSEQSRNAARAALSPRHGLG